eukprot:scaffold219340_cov16-Tisochrysis_lutea.AAC.2
MGSSNTGIYCMLCKAAERRRVESECMPLLARAQRHMHTLTQSTYEQMHTSAHSTHELRSHMSTHKHAHTWAQRHSDSQRGNDAILAEQWDKSGNKQQLR